MYSVHVCVPKSEFSVPLFPMVSTVVIIQFINSVYMYIILHSLSTSVKGSTCRLFLKSVPLLYLCLRAVHFDTCTLNACSIM